MEQAGCILDLLPCLDTHRLVESPGLELVGNLDNLEPKGLVVHDDDGDEVHDALHVLPGTELSRCERLLQCKCTECSLWPADG